MIKFSMTTYAMFPVCALVSRDKPECTFLISKDKIPCSGLTFTCSHYTREVASDISKHVCPIPYYLQETVKSLPGYKLNAADLQNAVNSIKAAQGREQPVVEALKASLILFLVHQLGLSKPIVEFIMQGSDFELKEGETQATMYLPNQIFNFGFDFAEFTEYHADVVKQLRRLVEGL